MEQRPAFFLHLSSSRFSCLSRWASLVYINIPAGVQGYLPCLCPTALLHGRHCFPLRPASTFQPQEQIQDSSGHEGTSSVVSPRSAFLFPTSVRPVGAAPRARPCRANRQSTVYRAEWTNMSPYESFPLLSVYTGSWAAMLAP